MKAAAVHNCWLLFQKPAMSMLIKAARLRTEEDYSASISGGLLLQRYRNCRNYSKCIGRGPAEWRVTIETLQRDGLISLVHPAKITEIFIK